MNRALRALAALAAALVFAGCGNSLDRDEARWNGETTYEVDGVTRVCDSIDEREDAVSQDLSSGWQPGCRKYQRMQDVAFGDFEGGQFPDPEPDDGAGAVDGITGEIGQSKDPITIGTGAGYRVDLNASGKILDFVGACRPSASGTPISCIVPSKVNFFWEVCPVEVCGQQTSDLTFMRDRFSAAWTVWRNAISSLSGCGGQGIVSTADSSRAFFQSFPHRSGNDNVDAYAFSTLPIYFEDITNQGNFSARVHYFGNMVPFSQVINNTRYYHYDAAGIIIDELFFEGNGAFGCGVTKPQLGATNFLRALTRGYERVFTHELGHVRGLPHLSTGIMRPGHNQTCGEVFQLPSPSALPIGDTTAKARIVVGSDAAMAAIQSMRDSSGVNVVSSSNTACVAPFTNDANDTTDFTSD